MPCSTGPSISLAERPNKLLKTWLLGLTQTLCRNRRLLRALGQHPRKGSLYLATSLRFVDHVPEPTGFQLGAFGLAGLQHGYYRNAVGLKQIHGLVVVALHCPTRDDSVQSFMVFVTGDIPRVSVWDFLGATTNRMSGKPLDMSEVWLLIAPFS